MKLKKIENAVVHCKTKEEAEVLIRETGSDRYFEEFWNCHKSDTCYDVRNAKIYLYGAYNWYKAIGFEITEFSDLIEQEETPKLTAEEVVEFLVMHYYDGEYGKAFGEDYRIDHLLDEMSAEEVVSKISKWKSEHEKQEKKEPEIEWVYRVFGAENYGEKFFQTEEEAIKRCEELAKSQKTKQYARYERVCRVKAVE